MDRILPELVQACGHKRQSMEQQKRFLHLPVLAGEAVYGIGRLSTKHSHPGYGVA